MSLLDTLKSLLGLGSSRGEPRRSDDVGVTVEREPETDSSPPEPPSSPGGSAEPEVDAETEHEVKGTDEASGPGSATAEPEAESAAEESDDERGDEEAATERGDDETGDGEPTTEIKGIGSSYADRLAEAGVETVADLAGADPDALADETGISEKRLGRWVERAANR
jgi:predicted flap endonuclease-1-like 5' DNA nuclease